MATSVCTFVEKVDCLKTYLWGGVLKIHVLHFRQRRDDSHHDDIIKSFLKNYEKVFILG